MRKVYTQENPKTGALTLRYRVKATKIVDGKEVAYWKRVNICCGTDKELYKKQKANAEKRLLNNETGDIDDTRTATDCLEAMLREYEVPRTIQTIRDSVTYFIRRYTILEMYTVTNQKISDWKAEMLRGRFKKGEFVLVPLGDNTIRRRLMDVRTWLNWAATNGWIKESPFYVKLQAGKRKGVKLPPEQLAPRFYSDQEIDAWEAAIGGSYWSDPEDPDSVELARVNEEEFRCICRMAYWAGMRLSEICTARAESVRWFPEQDGLIEGQIEVTSIKGGKPKKRIVPLVDEIMRKLPKRTSGYLFPRWVLNGAARHKKVGYAVHKMLKRAGITRGEDDAKATFYGFRHSFARIYLEKRPGDFKGLMDIMGHSNYEMIMKVYGNLSQTYLRNAVRNLPASGHRVDKIGIFGAKQAYQGHDGPMSEPEGRVSGEAGK